MGRAGAGGGGRVGSGGSGTRRSGGGHSPGRTGGGHSAGRSGGGGFRAGRGGFSKPSGHPRGGLGTPPPRGGLRMPPPPGGGPGMPPPRGGYGGYYPHHGGGCGCLTSILAIAAILFFAIVGLMPNLFASISQDLITSMVERRAEAKIKQKKANARKKLDTDHAYINDCVIDELGWVDDVPKTESQLKKFWEKTGVQPYILLREYDAELITDSEKEQWAIDYYDDSFDTENIFLFVYFAEEDTDNDVGYMAYANGYETTSVMDSDAVEIFWNNIDKYWYTDLSTDDVLVQVFSDTADTIIKD